MEVKVELTHSLELDLKALIPIALTPPKGRVLLLSVNTCFKACVLLLSVNPLPKGGVNG